MAVASYGAHLDGSELRDVLLAAEELGFESAWFPDHIAVPSYAAEANLSPPFLEPLAACAWGLGFTTRLRFGTDVLVAPYRHPLVVAAMAGTLGNLAGDRLILGVGIGYLKGEFEALDAGPYERRAEITERFLGTQRSLPVGYSIVTPPTPVPLWVGGNSSAAQLRAARWGDGWHPLWMPASDYSDARRRIETSRAAEGATGPFCFSYSCGATRLLDRPPTSWSAPPGRAPRGSEFRYAPEPWVDADNRPRFVGTPDQVVADLRLLETAGVEHVTLRFGPVATSDLEKFASEVLTVFGNGAQ